MSSSFRYTLTKLRTLPCSLKVCLRRSGNCAVREFSTPPTVEPATVTESCFPVNCRSGVGIKTLAISVDQLLFGRFGLVEVRQPAIGVVEFALLNGEHHERIPGAGIPQVGPRKIRVAIRVRVVDADQIHVALAGGAVGGQQIRGPQLIALGLRAFKGVLQRHGYHNALRAAVDGAQHCAHTLVGIRLARVRHYGCPGFGLDADHYSSQKCSLRYFSALSHSTVTIIAGSPRPARSRASSVEACTLQPEEMPTSSPSSRARRRTMR